MVAEPVGELDGHREQFALSICKGSWRLGHRRRHKQRLGQLEKRRSCQDLEASAKPVSRPRRLRRDRHRFGSSPSKLISRWIRQVLLGGRARVASSVGRGLRKFEDRLVAVVGIGFQAAEDNVIERRRDSARAARRRPRRIDVKLLVLDPRLTTKRQHTGQELD